MDTEKKETNKAENGLVTTEITSIADEEKKTGEKIEIPDSEKLVSAASKSFIASRKQLHVMMSDPKVSRRSLVRAVTAFMDLPGEGIPVF